MAFVVVLVGLAVFFIPRFLVRPIAIRLVLGKTAQADPDGFFLRFDLKRSLVGFEDFAHCAIVKSKKKRSVETQSLGDCAVVHQVSDWCSGVAIKMGRRLRCSSVTYRSRYAPSSRLAAGPFSSQPCGQRAFWPAALSLIGQRSHRVFSLFASRIQPKFAAAPLHQSLTWCTRPPSEPVPQRIVAGFRF